MTEIPIREEDVIEEIRKCLREVAQSLHESRQKLLTMVGYVETLGGQRRLDEFGNEDDNQ